MKLKPSAVSSAMLVLGLIEAAAQVPHLDSPLLLDDGTGPNAVVALPDGSLVASGFFPTSPTDDVADSLVVLDAGGRLIQRFSSPHQSILAALADGSLLTVEGPDHQLRHLKRDGSLDADFSTRFGSTAVYRALLQPDGGILVEGAFGGLPTKLRRILPDGTPDQGFFDRLAVQQLLPDLGDFGVYPDGRIILLAAAPGTPDRFDLVRLLSDGVRDPSFQPSQSVVKFFAGAQKLPLADGRLLGWQVSSSIAETQTVDGVECHGLVRLNADGSVDSSFTVSAATFAGAGIPTDVADTYVRNSAMLPDGRLYVALSWPARSGRLTFQPGGGAILRLLPDGRLDPSFRSQIYTHEVVQLIPHQDDRLLVVDSLQLNPDTLGHLWFHNSLQRLNRDGSKDKTFDAGELERSSNPGIVAINVSNIAPGKDYTIESSNDLQHWTAGTGPISTRTVSSDGRFTLAFQKWDEGKAAVYYRLVESP